MKQTIKDWVLINQVDEGKKNPLSHLGIDFEIRPMIQDEWKYKASKGEVMCDSSCGIIKGDLVNYDYIANDLLSVEGGELINIKNIRSYERNGELIMTGENLYIEKLEEESGSQSIILINNISRPTCRVKILHSSMENILPGEIFLVEVGFLVPEVINGKSLFRCTVEDVLCESVWG